MAPDRGRRGLQFQPSTSTPEVVAISDDSLEASHPLSSISDATSEDEWSDGVPLATSRANPIEINDEDPNVSPELQSTHHAQNVYSLATVSADYRHILNSDSQASLSDTEDETGVRIDTDPYSSLPRTPYEGSNVGSLPRLRSTIHDDSLPQSFAERLLGEVGPPIRSDLTLRGFVERVIGTIEQPSPTDDGDAQALPHSAGGYNYLRLQSFIAQSWSSFFEYFEPDAIYEPNVPSKNLSVAAFLRTWSDRRALQKPNRSIGIDYVPRIGGQLDIAKLVKTLPQIVKVGDLKMEDCNLQGINWKSLGTSQEAVREARRRTYLHHTNLMNAVIAPQYADLHGLSRFRRHTSVDGKGWKPDFPDIPRHDSHFRFREMNLGCKPCLTHFQLRNMLSASSKNAVFYAGEKKVLCLNPETKDEVCIMHFKGPQNDFEGLPMGDIGTLTATHDLLIVGGFQGQYAMKSLLSSNDDEYIKGRITDAEDGSTNHIHTFLARQSGLPRAVFCSNDARVRILDCSTNKVISEHKTYGKNGGLPGWAINCSVTSPDGRLRLLVGDQTDPWIVAADTGEHLASLPNHKDFGFACDWAPDGLHVATGNQDGIVQVFDSRNWSQPIQILPTELGGARTMKFSPLGSGKRVLAMAEPADYVSVVDAETFRSKQRFEFLGEIGGLSFTPDGSKLFVANTDEEFGGILECDRAGDGQRYGLARPDRRRKGDGWIVDEDLHLDDELLLSSSKRKRRGWGVGEVRF